MINAAEKTPGDPQSDYIQKHGGLSSARELVIKAFLSLPGAAWKKIFAAAFLAYRDKTPLKASALRRPVVHKRLSDFVALWSYIQRATPRERKKRYFFFPAAHTKQGWHRALRCGTIVALPWLGRLLRPLPKHFFRGGESWKLSQRQRSPETSLGAGSNH